MTDPFVKPEFIDPTTGEVIETSDMIVEELPKMGRWITKANQRLTHLNQPAQDCLCAECNLSREIDKLQGIKVILQAKITANIDFLRERARQLLDSTGQDKVKYHGLGTFRYRKLPEKVEITEGVDLTLLDVSLLIVKESVNPNKKAIKEYLNEGNIIAGISITRPAPKFEFKEE